MNEMEIVQYTLGGAFIVFVMFMVLAFKSPYSRAKMFRMFNPAYAIAELDQDSTNIRVKVIKTTDEVVKFEDKAYRIVPSKFKLVDGLPIIRFHYMSIEPASLRPWDAIQYVIRTPTGFAGKAQIELDGSKKGEKIIHEVEFSKAKEVGVTGWEEQLGPLKKFEHLSTPNELGGFLILKDAEAEAKSILMKVQAIEQLKLLLLAALLLSAIAAGVGYMCYDKLGPMNGRIEYQGTQITAVQNNLTTFMGMFSNSSITYQPTQTQPGIVPVR